jgi:hypothetical protein
MGFEELGCYAAIWAVSIVSAFIVGYFVVIVIIH